MPRKKNTLSLSPSPSPSPSPKRTFTVIVPKGQVSFRFLCPLSAISAVIGPGGSIIQRLVNETSAKIHVDDVFSSTCTERVIHVTGTANRKFRLRGDNDTEYVDVSAPQLGLLRVFERVFETNEPPVNGEIVRCRLLVGPGIAGAVIGARGERINRIGKITGAYVKVYSSDLLPPCARLADELLQISGDSLAVKKALVIVSRYIQEKSLQIGRDNGVNFPKVMNVETNNVGISGTVNGRGNGKDVIFRLLCPYDTAGAVFGPRGRKIKALEEETRASILISPLEDGCDERIITISAFENKESNYSCAQNAVIRVFNELASEGGRGAGAARLLIQPNQAGWFTGGPSDLSAIQKATGAKLQLLEHKAPFGASTNERIIQIDGEYSTVQVALFQVSWSLRERTFDDVVARLPRDSAPLLPHNLFKPRPHVEETATLTDRMKECRVSEEVNGSVQTSTDSPRDLMTANSDFGLGSGNKSVVVTNTKVEIVVREDMFNSVYGDGGSNLARLRLISGATVDVQDPFPGSDGKLIISGTHYQTLAAQSLLQTFLMAAQ